MALIFKRTVYAVHPSSTQTTRRRLIAVATISMVLALSVVVASTYIFSVGVLAPPRNSARSHDNQTNIPQSESNQTSTSEPRGNRTSRDAKTTQNPGPLPETSVTTTAAEVEKTTSSGVTKFSVFSTTMPTPTTASDASTTESHHGCPNGNCSSTTPSLSNSSNNVQADAPVTMNPDLARPLSETRSPAQLRHPSQTTTTTSPLHKWNFTTESSYNNHLPKTTKAQSNGTTKPPLNQRNQTETAGTDKNSMTQRPNDRVIAWGDGASETSDTASTKSSSGSTTEAMSISTSEAPIETSSSSTESTSAAMAQSLYSTTLEAATDTKQTTEPTTALTSSPDSIITSSNITSPNATTSNATSSNATLSHAASSIYYNWSDRWRNFRRQWSNSKTFILAHSGIVLMFSFLQFLVAASIALCVKDSMNDLKLHLITARWICMNSVIFLVLTCSLIAYALMGTDPEKLGDSSKFVPHHDPSYLHANVFSKSLISNIYAVLILSDITVLFILMIAASCFLRRNNIMPEEYEVCD